MNPIRENEWGRSTSRLQPKTTKKKTDRVSILHQPFNDFLPKIRRILNLRDNCLCARVIRSISVLVPVRVPELLPEEPGPAEEMQNPFLTVWELHSTDGPRDGEQSIPIPSVPLSVVDERECELGHGITSDDPFPEGWMIAESTGMLSSPLLPSWSRAPPERRRFPSRHETLDQDRETGLGCPERNPWCFAPPMAGLRTRGGG